MAEFVVMPKLGFDMQEGVLVGWTKQVGDEINVGDVVAEIESDKATLELESQVAGILLKTLAQTDDVVPVGANLAIVGEAGEDISGLNGGVPAEKVDEPVTAEVEMPASIPSTPNNPIDTNYPDGVKATPVARRLADERSVDLRQVAGTGPGGRIRKNDVEAYLTTGAKPTPKMPAVTPTIAGVTEQPLTRLRQTIARRMTESKTTIPQFYVSTELDMASALALRKELNETLASDGIKISVNDMIVKAVGLALRDFPNLNGSFAGDKLLLHSQINVGSAVAVEGGLLTVVQKDTDLTPLVQVATENREMIGRARAGKLHPDDVIGSTFTVSNLGAFDVDHFIAIVNPPEAAILAIGSAKQVPVVHDGVLGIGNRMKATISADHRVTDGVEAARFNQRFKEIMENPLQLLL